MIFNTVRRLGGARSSQARYLAHSMDLGEIGHSVTLEENNHNSVCTTRATFLTRRRQWLRLGDTNRKRILTLAYGTCVLGKSLQCPALQSHVHTNSRVDTRNLPYSYTNVSIWACIISKHVAYHVNKHGRDTLRI